MHIAAEIIFIAAILLGVAVITDATRRARRRYRRDKFEERYHSGGFVDPDDYEYDGIPFILSRGRPIGPTEIFSEKTGYSYTAPPGFGFDPEVTSGPTPFERASLRQRLERESINDRLAPCHMCNRNFPDHDHDCPWLIRESMIFGEPLPPSMLHAPNIGGEDKPEYRGGNYVEPEAIVDELRGIVHYGTEPADIPHGTKMTFDLAAEQPLGDTRCRLGDPLPENEAGRVDSNGNITWRVGSSLSSGVVAIHREELERAKSFGWRLVIRNVQQGTAFYLVERS